MFTKEECQTALCTRASKTLETCRTHAHPANWRRTRQGVAFHAHASTPSHVECQTIVYTVYTVSSTLTHVQNRLLIECHTPLHTSYFRASCPGTRSDRCFVRSPQQGCARALAAPQQCLRIVPPGMDTARTLLTL